MSRGRAGASRVVPEDKDDGTVYGYTFFRSVYGRAVAGDYRHAALVATVRDPQAKVTSNDYRGKIYGYVVTGGYVALQTQS